MGKHAIRSLMLSVCLTACASEEEPAADGWIPLADDEAIVANGDAYYVGPEGRFRAPPRPVEIAPAIAGGTFASERGEEEAIRDLTQELIFGADNRVAYTSTATLTGFNKRTIGHVRSSGGDCSGALIGPRHVLTAAHCIDNLPSYNGITFTPGERGYGFGDTTPNGDARRSVGYYLRSSTDVWDYAVVILEDRADTASLGNMGIWWSSDDDWYEDRNISLVGYPYLSHDCANSPWSNGACGGFMYGESCPVDWADEDIEFECDAQSGQSGSPVYTWVNGSPLIVGVLRGSTSTPLNNWNKAVRLDFGKMLDICAWVNSHPSAHRSHTCQAI